MDAVEMLAGRKPVQPYSMVLTFDDGYRNNFTHALPILRRYNAPATFFIPTGYLDNPRPFWFDRLDYALQQVPVGGCEVKVGSFTMRVEGGGRDALRKSYKRLRRTAKRLHMSDIEFLQDMEQLAEQLEAESGRALADIWKDDDWSAITTWEEIRQVPDERVTFGSHTVDHIRLNLVDAEIARDQLTKSKRDIEIHTGKSCFSLCYPSGNFSRETNALVRECGYLCALTTKEGLNYVGGDLMELRRINLPANIDGNDLMARMCSLSQGLSHIKNRVVWLCRKNYYTKQMTNQRGLGSLQDD
jgi:peptidoglycan/xylan/chitin deacetylase (PgdA/CDA1 family)